VRADHGLRLEPSGCLSAGQGESEVCISTGTARTIRAIPDIQVSFGSMVIEVRVPAPDVPILWSAECERRAQTGWQPQTRFEQITGDLLYYWRERINRANHE
jgi:hypothetical protein